MQKQIFNEPLVTTTAPIHANLKVTNPSKSVQNFVVFAEILLFFPHF